MTENNHKTEHADHDNEESREPDRSHSYYYDDATGYEVFHDDDDDEPEAEDDEGTGGGS